MPVVEWVTVRLLFTLGLVEDWKTASIDFANAFMQASLPEPIFLELPPGYAEANPELANKVIKVKTSLYGDRRAANLWYQKIAATLVDNLKFSSSELDPCLFIRQDCIIVLYVDDAISWPVTTRHWRGYKENYENMVTTSTVMVTSSRTLEYNWTL